MDLVSDTNKCMYVYDFKVKRSQSEKHIEGSPTKTA